MKGPFQVKPEILNWIEVWILTQPLQNINFTHFFNLFLFSIGSTFGVTVLLSLY